MFGLFGEEAMGSHGQCAHDHDCGEADCSASYSLYKHVDLPRVTCLNELEVREDDRKKILHVRFCSLLLRDPITKAASDSKDHSDLDWLIVCMQDRIHLP